MASIGEIIASDRAGRGAPRLFHPAWLQGAAKALGKAQRVAVVTGFLIPEAMVPETDGPPGAVWIARVLLSHGRSVSILTDQDCLNGLSAAAQAAGVPNTVVRPFDPRVEVSSFDLLLYVERMGRSADGTYRNMRGLDVTPWVAPWDRLALEALDSSEGPWVAAVGDGGNEAGMGSFREILSSMLPHFAPCLSVVGSHFPVAVDVSNWGAYALAGEAFGGDVIPSPEEEMRMLEAMLDAGAVDGATLRRERSVDGFGEEELRRVLEELKRFFDRR
ncbi:MAG: DUF4392 domain-containing protein [Thermanaerothrix sp.]|nr:DUF4392 domain-containing protein [Thermanaerothrix sp.]